jgi:cyanophycinase-like exopeptidase
MRPIHYTMSHISSRFLLLFLVLNAFSLPAQTAWQSFFSGDTADVTVPVSGGLVLMGGGGENDNAMRWFLEQCKGGDVVVLRASGADGYNKYMFSELGVAVNSVQTIVTTGPEAANDLYIARQIRHAEGLWIAGGDQANYVRWWKDSPIGDALRYLIEEKKAAMGGTSAGMAILGEAYFAALNDGITSAEALANPFHEKVTVGGGDFLQHPLLHNVITDTHYDARNRQGRHLVFMARAMKDFRIVPVGIAGEEQTAVCIDPAGYARVFGRFPKEQDYVWFLRVNCANDISGPEILEAGKPLHWYRKKAAVNALKIPGKQDGSAGINLRTWESTPEGKWENWWVDQGVIHFSAAVAPPPCLKTALSTDSRTHFPAPKSLPLSLSEAELPAVVRLFDLHGQLVRTWTAVKPEADYRLPAAVGGAYILSITGQKEKSSRMVEIQ